uniref:Uncharacterized protein n=1 Tax=Avena sativa TaxID=4498 RepID=A0ACD5UYG5_AVESA
MQCMAQESSEASVASSPPAPPHPPSSATWWRDMNPYSTTPAWPPPPAAAAPRWPPFAHHHHHQQQHRTSSSGAEDDMSASNTTMQTSYTNTSTTNHSGISMDDSAAAAAAAAAESHLWNQVLMGAGGEVGRSMQAVHDAHDDSENFLDLLNSRTLAPELFAEPPACDYLKKMEYGGSHHGGGPSWSDVHQFNATNMEKHLAAGGAGYVDALAHHDAPPERLTANLSDLVSNWSIAPPNPCHGPVGQCDDAASMGHGGAKALFLDSSGNVKHEMGGHGAMLQEAAGSSSTSSQDFTRPVGLGYNNSMLGLSNRMYGGGDAAMEVQWGSNSGGDARSLSDLISFGGTIAKPAPSASPARASSAEYSNKKQGQEISSPVPVKTSSGGGKAASSEGKKKRSEEEKGSEGSVKKSKHEASSPTSSSLKAQVPKVKLGDKITALQQIVSPFGKTDTASVLYEAINYIKWLHEQVQLLSDPYMKSSSSKDYNPWGGLDRKEKAEAEADLRSRGLCLVPVSCTPQVYRDSNGPDYWTPPYRSCLYR